MNHLLFVCLFLSNFNSVSALTPVCYLFKECHFCLCLFNYSTLNYNFEKPSSALQYQKLQIKKFHNFLEQIQSECGPISTDEPELKQKLLYYKKQNLKNELFSPCKNVFPFHFKVGYQNQNQFKSGNQNQNQFKSQSGSENESENEFDELIKEIEISEELAQKTPFLQLYNANKQKSAVLSSLRQLLKLNPPEEYKYILTLICFCQTVNHSGLDDNVVIQAQNYGSMIFNDRQVNQRLALTMVLPVIENLMNEAQMKMFIDGLLGCDTKMYEEIHRESMQKINIQTYSWIISHSYNINRKPGNQLLESLGMKKINWVAYDKALKNKINTLLGIIQNQ